MLSVPKKANDAMHLSMLEGDEHSPLVVDDADALLLLVAFAPS